MVRLAATPPPPRSADIVKTIGIYRGLSQQTSFTFTSLFCVLSIVSGSDQSPYTLLHLLRRTFASAGACVAPA